MTLVDDPWRDNPPADPPPGLLDDEPSGAHRGIRPARLGDLVLGRDQLADLPAPQPLIDGTLDLGTVGVLAGAWGSGKSFQALDWACCVATGRPWQGRPVQTTRVLFVAAEGAYGLHERIRAWETAWGLPIPSDQLHVLPQPVNLTRPAERVALLDEVERGDYGLVVVDTLARCIVGADENSAQDMGQVVDVLYQLRDATNGGTVLVVHHTGKDKRTVRGSSALEAGVDLVYLAVKDCDEVTLVRTKRKDGPEDDEHLFALAPVAGTDSVILSVRGDVRGVSRTDQLMSVFVSAFSETGASKAELRNAAALPSASFARALNNLVKDGYLVNEGTAKRPFYRAAS